MGNTLPVTIPPKPSPTRAVIFMQPQTVFSYCREPWKRGELRIVGSSPDDELPPALSDLVPPEEYREIMSSVAERAANYRGGAVQIGCAMFQACLFFVVVLGFFASKYAGFRFFNPITLGVLGVTEFVVLSQSAKLIRREEEKLVKEMLEVVHPWRQQYDIIAKMRKSRGKAGEELTYIPYYCLVLEIDTDHDTDTVDLSTSSMTDMESDIEEQSQ